MLMIFAVTFSGYFCGMFVIVAASSPDEARELASHEDERGHFDLPAADEIELLEGCQADGLPRVLAAYDWYE